MMSDVGEVSKAWEEGRASDRGHEEFSRTFGRTPKIRKKLIRSAE